MVLTEAYKLKSILDSFLGDSKQELDDNYQLEYPCPLCRAEHGEKEDKKYNLSISLSRQVFNCWKCSSVHDEMHGSILRLIKLYGNDDLLKEYKETIYSLRQSKLYELNFTKDDFNIDNNIVVGKAVELPSNFIQFKENNFNHKKPLEYLLNRGITWDIIKKHKIGYTLYDEKNKMASSRIILPSYNEYGELNYWVGRDYTDIRGRQKYCNPILDKKEIIFNEDLIQWDADITIVEGPFDHIVVPNSIPLLGKVLKTDFNIFQKILHKAHANVNLWLDADAFEDVKKIYQLLNHDSLYGKVRYVPTPEGEDPSSIFQKYGKKGVIQCLQNASKIDEIYLT